MEAFEHSAFSLSLFLSLSLSLVHTEKNLGQIRFRPRYRAAGFYRHDQEADVGLLLGFFFFFRHQIPNERDVLSSQLRPCQQ